MTEIQSGKIHRALFSVSDKNGVIPFAEILQNQFGVTLLSTGGTAVTLRSSGLRVKEVSEYTCAPEIFDGRVKTLHPKIHGGILYRRGHEQDEIQRAENEIEPIDLLVINLYPFRETVANGGNFNECVENIDIGGPAMIRAAAKNHAHVAIITDPDDYELVLKDMREHDGAVTQKTRSLLAVKAYSLTASYDAAVAEYLRKQAGVEFQTLKHFAVGGVRTIEPRYGENAHQQSAFYQSDSTGGGAACGNLIQGKPLSYNNLNDADAAYEAVFEFSSEQSACVIVKHANPCGVAVASDQLSAYVAALRCDPVSAFGGIIAFNQPLEAETAKKVIEIFTEVIIAPGASEEAISILESKKNLRLIFAAPSEALSDSRKNLTVRSLRGGLLVQDADSVLFDDHQMKIVTKRAPTEKEMSDLRFAFTVAKHVKSNAIVYAKDLATVGIGAGQMNRLDSSRIAALKAKEIADRENLSASPAVGSVVASDAFFPFADGLIAAAEAGVTAIIQPGGSVKDQEVIDAANERNLAMVFTGMRHFRH